MSEKFEGMVLFTKPHKEKDALVKVFTENFGTKMFFVKNLKKSNHPLTKNFIPLTINEYVGKINESGLSFITEAETKQFNRTIQTDYVIQSYAIYISQLVDASIDDNLPNAGLYHQFYDILLKFNEGISPKILTIYMEIHLLKQFGIHLNWTNCCICHSVKEPFDFSIINGGLLCSDHFNEDEHRLKIDGKAMHVAYVLANIKINQIGTVEISNHTYSELRRLIDELYKEFVGIRLKSKSYIDKMEKFENNLNV